MPCHRPSQAALSLSAGACRAQYHTLQAGFSSRSQGRSGDTSVSDSPESREGGSGGSGGSSVRKPSGPHCPPLPAPQTFRPIARPACSPVSWSSRSVVDLSSGRRLSSAQSRGSALGAAGYGGARPAAPPPTRPTSFHERGGVGSWADHDTLSLHSLSLGAGGPDDRYGVVEEWLEPAAASPYRASASERRASSSSGRAGGLGWLEAAEGPPSRTIRAPAVRTLQRFQSGHRSRVAAGGVPGGVLEPVTRAPSVRSLSISLGNSGHLPDTRGLDSYGGHRTLQRLSSG